MNIALNALKMTMKLIWRKKQWKIIYNQIQYWTFLKYLELHAYSMMVLTALRYKPDDRKKICTLQYTYKKTHRHALFVDKDCKFNIQGDDVDNLDGVNGLNIFYPDLCRFNLVEYMCSLRSPHAKPMPMSELLTREAPEIRTWIDTKHDIALVYIVSDAFTVRAVWWPCWSAHWGRRTMRE